jgi:hypothetical protein
MLQSPDLCASEARRGEKLAENPGFVLFSSLQPSRSPV